MFLPSAGSRSPSTWLVDYFPVIEQGLVDLIQWVEEGVAPPNTAFDYVDGRVQLPARAKERGGIQPVVTVTANGGASTSARVGDPVQLAVNVEVPPNAGTIIAVDWDFDGSGSYPFGHDVDGSQTSLRLTTTHSYDQPGTYFATARVCSHREGKVDAAFRRIPNLASVRIVVG
jgi:PKD domain